ncbi:MAG: UDP-glucose 4-epimerase GalE [Saprospirales bacterium]|nr:UDP-glucose 4-epimerase GalE [Saprospirales bacterium]
MRVLVTGATGYIGSHVCKLLSEHGHEVWGFDKNIHGEYNDVEKYCHKFWIQDIMDKFLHGRADAVVHLAGRSVVPDSLKEPSEYYRVNVMGTKNAVEKLQHDHFLFASTSAAWEMASPYARSKVAAEDVIKEKANGHTIFRFFNVSGTDGVHRQLGVPTHLIRVAAMVAAGKIPDLKIFGTDYATRDGTCIRDYIHVVDLATAIVNAVERGPANTPYECLGSNTGFTVREVIDTMQEVTGKKLNIIEAPRREGDAVTSVVDKLSKLVTLNKSIQDMCLDQYKLERG